MGDLGGNSREGGEGGEAHDGEARNSSTKADHVEVQSGEFNEANYDVAKHHEFLQTNYKKLLISEGTRCGARSLLMRCS